MKTASWFYAESEGRVALRQLLQEWLRRNGWSLNVVSRLGELSLLAEADVPCPEWAAGMEIESGSWVCHRGHAWEAIGSPRAEPAEGAPGWIDRGLSIRLHATGLNLFLRGKKATLSVQFLAELGRINEWVARVQAGTAIQPADPRLRDLVSKASVIADVDGPFGPEELLSVALCRLKPPQWADAPCDATEGVTGRQLRSAAAAAGIDLVDDWPQLAALYPCNEPERVSRLQQVLLGLGQWSPKQQEDEQAACLVLLQRLQAAAGAD